MVCQRTIHHSIYLMDIGEYECSDVRDRVCGVTRLLEWDKMLGSIVPDHTKTRKEVLLQAVQRWAPFLEGYQYVCHLIDGLELDPESLIYQDYYARNSLVRMNILAMSHVRM